MAVSKFTLVWFTFRCGVTSVKSYFWHAHSRLWQINQKLYPLWWFIQSFLLPKVPLLSFFGTGFQLLFGLRSVFGSIDKYVTDSTLSFYKIVRNEQNFSPTKKYIYTLVWDRFEESLWFFLFWHCAVVELVKFWYIFCCGLTTRIFVFNPPPLITKSEWRI